MSKKVFVMWNKASPHGIGMPAKDAVSRIVHLAPGLNTVDEADWLEAKKIKVIQHYISEGDLAEVEGGAMDPEEVGGALEVRSPAEAVKLIEETLDDELLGKWAAVERRPEVAAAIAAQKKAIDPAEDIKAKAEGALNPEVQAQPKKGRR